MQIILADYKEGQTTSVHCHYNPRELKLEFVDLIYTKDLDLQGSVCIEHETLRFQGRMTSEIEHVCGRCLKRVKDHIDCSFDLYYSLQAEGAMKQRIETTDELREILILEHALSYVCNDHCKGLCPQCGIDRNAKGCRCTIDSHPSAFSMLRNIKP